MDAAPQIDFTSLLERLREWLLERISDRLLERLRERLLERLRERLPQSEIDST